jgi:hypothetical protein
MASNTHIYIIYPRHGQGVALGNALIAAYLKAQATISQPKVLICGKGKQIYYMLETFVMHREGIEAGSTDSLQKQISEEIKNNFLLMTDAEFFMKEGGHIQEIVTPLDPWPPSRKIRSYLVRLGIKEALRKTPNFGLDSLDLHILQIAPYELLNIELAWQAFGPFHIIVASDEAVEKLLIVLSEICNVVGRTSERLCAKDDGGQFVTPLIIIDAESGKMTRLRNIGDGVVYYDLFSQNIFKWAQRPDQAVNGFYYPSQFGLYRRWDGVAVGDCLIDVFDDAKEQVMGLQTALQRHKASEPAIEMQLCECNRPGSLAKLCAQLSGLEFATLPDKDHPSPPFPSFAYCRYIQQGDENCCFAGFAGLSAEDIGDCPPVWKGLLLPVTSDSRRKDKATDLLDPIANHLKLRPLDFDHGDDKRLISDICACACPGSVNCSVANMQRRIEVRGKLKGDMRRPPRYYVALDSAQHLIDKMNSAVERHHERLLVRDTFAKVTMCCRQAKKFGTSAFALNALRLNRLQDKAPAEFPFSIVNLTYLRDFDCYEDSVSNMTMYGNIQKIGKDLFENRRNELLNPGPSAHPIKAILIRPTPGGFTPWEDFASKLIKFLALTSPANKFVLYPEDPDRRKRGGTLLVMDEELHGKMINHFAPDVRQGKAKRGKCFCDSGGWEPEKMAYNDCPMSKDLEALWYQWGHDIYRPLP